MQIMRFLGPTIRSLLQQSISGTVKAAGRSGVNKSSINDVKSKTVITEVSRAKILLETEAGIKQKSLADAGSRVRTTPFLCSSQLAATVRAEQLSSRQFLSGNCYCPIRSFSTNPISSRLSFLMSNKLRISPNPQSSPLHCIFKRDANTTSLNQMHRRGPVKKFRPPRKPLDGRPMMKGVVLKPVIKKPKKPNSANRKCVLVRLSNGKEKVAYVPGIGHNLQEHNVVLVRCGRLQDVPGVKLKCIRGVHDLPHVIKQSPHK